MSKATTNLEEAQKRAMSLRPAVGGFPVLAETLRLAGVRSNHWILPSCQSLYVTEFGTVVQTMPSLITKTADVPKFDEKALLQALRTDQAGKSSFPEFLKASWEAGVIGYDVDFVDRTCTYFGADGETYVEDYPAVEIE